MFKKILFAVAALLICISLLFASMWYTALEGSNYDDPLPAIYTVVSGILVGIFAATRK